jgi:hypothetical protein
MRRIRGDDALFDRLGSIPERGFAFQAPFFDVRE